MLEFLIKIPSAIYRSTVGLGYWIAESFLYLASNIEYKLYVLKLILKNFMFIFMIAAVCFVFFSKKITDHTRKRLLLIKFVLFMAFLLLTFTSSIDRGNFIDKKIVNVDLNELFDFNELRIEVKDSADNMILFEKELKHEKGLKIYYNSRLEDLHLLIFSLLKNSPSKVIHLTYRYQPEDWENNYPYILQNIKQDLLYYSSYKSLTIIFDNLPLELLTYDFLDLLIMFENNFDHLGFVVLENKVDNFQLLRSRYDYLNIVEVKELDPEVFKSIIIKMITKSKRMRLTDVKAARIAHETYISKGASIHELSKIHKKYYGI